jgi:hypothetical protein
MYTDAKWHSRENTGMAKKDAPKDARAIKPRQFRLSDETMTDLDLVATAHGLSTATEAVRFLARKEAKKIQEQSSR